MQAKAKQTHALSKSCNKGARGRLHILV